ncbi:glycosyltransferase [Flaviflexus ciconiae]|uniref:Glycosyltransferase n=1 Tax=Flaviflexus ciconiae TaxID=2496867 RepID=A0A3Q9G3G6_9ACTO|nr:glycosyltransferase [Flaviflexus ciconiae]AZQ76496.1 glycosyltransferase [Flaviflexus ciconiae]
MNNIVRTLKSKRGLLYTGLVGLATLIAIIVVAIADHAELIAATLLIGLIGWLILIALELVRMCVETVRKDMRQTKQQVGKIDYRVGNIAQDTRNTAGSVGKAVPMIRTVHEAAVHMYASGFDGEDVGDSGAGMSARPFLDTNMIPESTMPDVAPKRTTKAMVIADEFTLAAFAPEWIQLTPTPDTWKQIIDDENPDLFFIESAWEGNDGSWRYHLVGTSAPRPAVVDAIAYAKSKNIPVVFWNKEDPPHFEDFLDVARLADYVFTTDGDLVPEYTKRLGHNRIGLLPFAAQPLIHNPVKVSRFGRARNIAFGGMYFRDKYPERRAQMDYLLPAAHDFGLEIFSRQLGKDPAYQFPAPYDSAVVGSLAYPQMITAYKLYKAVLNVNSVVTSSTMCARRIFEATACGTAVVTPPSPAIDHFFGDALSVVSDQDEATRAIRLLTRSSEYRDRKVHEAQRIVWEKNTYSHRVDTILETIGQDVQDVRGTVSVFISTNVPGSAAYISENLLRQVRQPEEVVIVSHGFDFDESEFDAVREAGIIVKLIFAAPESSLGQNLNLAIENTTGDVLVRMDDDDWYGKNYVRDQLHALDFSGATLVGKAASYIYFESTDSTVLTYPQKENKIDDFVRGATFVAKREVFLKYPFSDQSLGEDSALLQQIRADGGKIYSTDRFNFIVNRWEDKGRHTWSVADEELFSTGMLQYMGNAQDQLEV